MWLTNLGPNPSRPFLPEMKSHIKNFEVLVNPYYMYKDEPFHLCRFMIDEKISVWYKFIGRPFTFISPFKISR